MARKKFKPLTAYDLADDNPRVIANHLRMLQQEMRDGFDLLGNRLMSRLDAHESRLERLEDQERRRERAEKRKAR